MRVEMAKAGVTVVMGAPPIDHDAAIVLATVIYKSAKEDFGAVFWRCLNRLPLHVTLLCRA